MSNMLDILRNFDAVGKSVAECPPEMDGQMGSAPAPGINIQLDNAGQMAQLLQALQMVQQGEAQEEVEEYDNEPEEEYMDLDTVLPSGDDLHKKKTMHKAQAMGDNPMNVESIKDRLWAALNEKKMPMGAGPDGKKGTDDDKPAFLNQKTGDKKSKGGSKPKKGVVPPQFKK